ncbi:MAG: ATP-binding protein [Candidatus Promineifilaceae bacterium]
MLDGEQSTIPLDTPILSLQQLIDFLTYFPGESSVICLDTQFRYLYFNQNHKDSMKNTWDADIELGRSLLDYISNEEDSRLAKVTLDHMFAGENIEAFQTYGAKRAAIQSNYSLLRDEQGNIFGILIASTDFTERRRIQQNREEAGEALENQVRTRSKELQIANERLHKEIAERRQFKEALQASEEQFRNAFEQSTSAILLLDTELAILQTNHAFTKLTGYHPEESLGKKLAPLLAIKEDAFDDFKQISPLQVGENWNRNFHIQGKSGREFEISLAISGLYQNDHQLVEYLATLQNITLRRELEKAQQQFMHSISHEMRTPLTNLVLYLDLLKKNPSKVQYLNILSEQVGRLQALINGVLEITSLTLSKGTTTWSIYQVQVIIKTAIASFRPLARRRRITFEITKTPQDMPTMTGDPGRLAQALSEIIKNAVNFSQEGKKVTITAEEKELNGYQWVTIQISDTGPGILPDEVSYIFENLYRGQVVERNNIPGAGLGLPIAQVIIKAHGGQITVESTPGEGSTFTVWLPTPQTLIGATTNG